MHDHSHGRGAPAFDEDWRGGFAEASTREHAEPLSALLEATNAQIEQLRDGADEHGRR